MVPTTSASINAFLANNFSDVGSRSGVVPAQSPFVLPQSVTPADTADESALNDRRNQQQQQQQQLQQLQSRQRSLRDLARPQVSILPSDEAELFAVRVLDTGNSIPQVISHSADVSDTANRIRRQALAVDDREKLSEDLQKRAQQSVATLYARNNNVVYNVTPIFYEAA